MQKATKASAAAAAPGIQKPATKLNKKQRMKQRMQAMRDRAVVVRAQRRTEALAAAAKATTPDPPPSEPLEAVDPAGPVAGENLTPPPPSAAATPDLPEALA